MSDGNFHPKPLAGEPVPGESLEVKVQFFSYFKELAGVTQTVENLAPGSTIADLMSKVHARFPQLAAMAKSTLIAVGLEYQDKNYVLQPGDEISLFPPVQGG